MPRYDYRCTDAACEERFEVTQGFYDEPVAQCPVCDSSARRLISPVAVHFKGSGFYVTDNRASNGAAAGGGSGSKDGESSSESKPAAAKKSEKSDSKSGGSKAADKKSGRGSSRD